MAIESNGAALRQGEPEFERLKRELEEVKNAPRGLEGTFRTAAEMERHRAQLADAAIEEQIEVRALPLDKITAAGEGGSIVIVPGLAFPGVLCSDFKWARQKCVVDVGH